MTDPSQVADVLSNPDRLAALESHHILDIPPDPGFDGIVVLARALCAAPVALMSFVAGDRQWFKARSGFPACGSDLDASVCKHVVGRRDLLVIPDLTRDARTNANPLVVGEPRIRFYAGAPLMTSEGHGLGALCVIDTEARPAGLTEEQRDCLRVLAGLAMTQLAMHRRLLGAGSS